MDDFIRYSVMSPEKLITELSGFYRCPREVLPGGTVLWLGPLAGYTSRSADGKQRVGPEYVNFRVIQENPIALASVACKVVDLAREIVPQHFENDLTFCGIPTGGRAIVQAMPKFAGSGVRAIWAEKQEYGSATITTRPDKKLWFTDAMRPRRGQRIALVEDIGNAFSTTAEVIDLIEAEGVEVVVIVLFLNRSLVIRGKYSHRGRKIPVRALWEEPMPIYDQTDPLVATAIATGNYRLETKKHWPELMAAMRR